jgi:hypothetical protein
MAKCGAGQALCPILCVRVVVHEGAAADSDTFPVSDVLKKSGSDINHQKKPTL